MSRPRATPAAEIGRELGAVLDRIDRKRADLAELVKERKGEIAKLEARAFKLRDLLAGRDFDQLDVPGTETSEVLAEAHEVAGRKGAP